MKKTLTVNLGGIVYNIDEDAYRLLDNYLNNLKQHFGKQSDSDEIVNDIEQRISELFGEKLSENVQVITIVYVEEVIARIGSPEEMESYSESDDAPHTDDSKKTYSYRRYYRNPDDKILGGVISGLAAYLNCDATALRLLVFVFMILGVGILIPIYLVVWVIVPEAHTATEKLNMHGINVTLENIGKTVTDSFERAAEGVNNFMRSDKPRTFVQRMGDALATLIGFVLKLCLIILALVFSPILVIMAFMFVALIINAIAMTVGGTIGLAAAMPQYTVLMPDSPFMGILMYTLGLLMVGIPLVSTLFVVLRFIFKWKPMASGLKNTLIILWVVSFVGFIVSLIITGITLPELFMWMD
ncbi:MAG: PspC domain-containing protein [Mediterranea sp.]|jgi:phage shock protein PspC (stress-responsive transcriptional regulator)|nr:PspC domain-containing protein [Mediterranea sp.]